MSTTEFSRTKMPDPSTIKVTPAKGRPMLTWIGKRPLTQVTAFPSQQVEIYGSLGNLHSAQSVAWAEWPSRYPQGGLLFYGDNKEVLAHLLANGFRGMVKLIYIDPPFNTGVDYVRKHYCPEDLSCSRCI